MSDQQDNPAASEVVDLTEAAPPPTSASPTIDVATSAPASATPLAPNGSPQDTPSTTAIAQSEDASGTSGPLSAGVIEKELPPPPPVAPETELEPSPVQTDGPASPARAPVEAPSDADTLPVTSPDVSATVGSASPSAPAPESSASPSSPSITITTPASASASASAPRASVADAEDDDDDDDMPPPPPPKPDTPLKSPSKPALPAGTPVIVTHDTSADSSPAARDSPSKMPSAPPVPSVPNTPAQQTPATPHSAAVSPQATSSPRMTSRPQSRAQSRAGPMSPALHSRSGSTNTMLSLATGQVPAGNAPQLSAILITQPLQLLVESKEARKSASFLAASQRALELCRAGDGHANAAYLHPREIFEPLRLAISFPQTTSVPVLVTSLDLLAKLISHSFFSEPNGPPPGMPPLPDLITHTITLSYTENSAPQVALQVVKALMAIVLSTDPGMLVHQSSLLKAVRTVYNVFLLSTDTNNQIVAQGGLTQMVHHVFSRVVRPADEPHRASSVNGLRIYNSTPVPEGAATPKQGPKLTLESFMAPNPNDAIPNPPSAHSGAAGEQPQLPSKAVEIPNGDALETAVGGAEHEAGSTDESGEPIPTEELFVKDAFLVFRALCKLSMKSLVAESELDLRSHAMRSKLLSLHLVLTILKSHADLFTNPAVTIPSNSSQEHTPFLQATKQYLCQSLSRNAVSPVNQVFELSTEIFWCVLASMRAPLKKEIEVLLNEIFIPILEMRHSTIRQKSLILSVFIRLCRDPQALVEIYLNYDCDRAAPENIYEKLMNIVSRIGQTHFAPPSKEELNASSSKQASSHSGPAIPPSLTTSALSAEGHHYAGLSPEIKLRRQSLECLIAALKSLAAWSSSNPRHAEDTNARSSEDSREHRRSISELHTPTPSREGARTSISGFPSGSATPEVEDDVTKLESAKQRKTMLLDGIKKFNFKPKRGIEYLVQNGFIPSRTPQDIATFILKNDGLSKMMIGEYLGEGDEENVAIMHAFVDMLDFTGIHFTPALRMYLQTFRLPGEAQKIDRFMLKFAERYIHQNPDGQFANADAAYVLAFSVIMLNTDQHNKNMKQKRMTKEEFVKNNRGINDGSDLPEEMLGEIYDEIQNNEIKMKDEVEAVGAGPGGLASVGRDLKREAFLAQSENMANKTEALLKSMARTQRRSGFSSDHFYAASRVEHVHYMFEVSWMPFLAGISAQMQETDDMEVVEMCLDGFRAAIRIVCLFDMELERNAFVTTLAKFTFLNNLAEMKPKNMEAIKTLLDIAIQDGNNLKGSWKEVLTCVSQLERMQLISSGMDVPDLGRRTSTSTRHSRQKSTKRRAPTEELAEESRSSGVTVAADKVFSLSQNLSGGAIVDFVKALSEVSWEEIQSSGSSTHPRMFSLQKLVEISYYNMGRIRLEWSNIWAILGEHFNQVCCHNNPNVSFFALDALRQLAMNFLQKEELSHFRFQKEFLRPFEYTIRHNMNSDAREMVLQCLQQMIQARVQNLRSGWQTMFGVFSAASRVLTERVCNYAFELVTLVYREHFSLIVRFGAFPHLASCLTDFCKVTKFQKISLQAIEMLRGLVPKMLENPECLLPTAENNAPTTAVNPSDDPMMKYWLPVLNSFFDIIMTAEDLEVRRVALDCLFDTLKKHGKDFSTDFWNVVTQRTLFPIFAVLRAKGNVRFRSAEDMSVWLSTTLISALRDLIDLYTYYFETLQLYLDGLLDILVACICQENDTLARIGTSCFQQLLENNVTKLSPHNWEVIVTAFVQLFRTTTAYQLFDPVVHSEVTAPSDYVDDDAPFNKFVAPAPLEPVTDNPPTLPPTITYAEQRRIFAQVIVKCVLQLLLIETTHELLNNEGVYDTIPAEHLLRFMGVLDDSWRFARKFNADKQLRTALWKVGFMRQLPNLLKQESSAASTLINVLLRMYRDPREAHKATRGGVLDRLVPLSTEVISDYIAIDAETYPRHVAAWSPVVADIVRGVVDFDDASFNEHLPGFYPLVTGLLMRETSNEMRLAMRNYFVRVGEVRLGVPAVRATNGANAAAGESPSPQVGTPTGA